MRKLQVSGITYNINGQRSSKDDIFHWLTSEENLAESELVCIALQEVSHAEMFSAIPQASTWTAHITEWMVEHGLLLVHRLCLASNMLLVFGVQRILHLIAKVDTRWSRNSYGGAAGYKGTMSVRLRFKNKLASITFVTSHFFHGEKNFRKRIQQYHSSLVCTFEDDLVTTDIPRAVIWLGDLNSRVEGFVNSSEMIKRLKKCNEKDIDGIVQGFDQLTKSRRAGDAFVEFEEPTISFKPSYRIVVCLLLP
ncbi:inositol polyphosphate 5-phosphatase [Ditylenchus destructor]|nr:inositol polyphosphate 5-phosphatase [Ditylenchus destructor]